jgi:hypothetical protein
MKISKILVSLALVFAVGAGFGAFSGIVHADPPIVNNLTLTGVTPDSGPAGSTITLIGTGFNQLNINTMYGGGVWFTDGVYSANLYNSQFHVLSDTMATAVVPTSLCYGVEGNCMTEHYDIAASGVYSIYIKANLGNVGIQQTASVKFVVTTNSNISLQSVSPSAATVGAMITVKGSGFNSLASLPPGGNGHDGIWFTMGSYSVNLFQSQFHLVDNNTFTAVVPGYGCPGKETDSCSSNFSTPLPEGYYSIYVVTNGGTQVSNSVVFHLVLTPTTSSHPIGSNVVGSDGTVYFISAGNTRSPYTSAGAFLSYKFNSWSNLQTANSADMNLSLTSYFDGNHNYTYFIPPRNGSLINDHGTVYLITNGQRAGFTSANVFLESGYSFGNVYAGDTSFMTTLSPINSSAMGHSEGTLINDNGTMYVIKGGFRLGFPSMSVLESWGFWVQDAVPANSYDRNIPMGGIVQTRQADQINI